MKTKLTEEQIQLIKESDKSLNELAKELGVTSNTIKYYQSEEFRDYLREYQRERYNKLTPEQKKELLNKKREYQKEYHKKRYNNDNLFREKQIQMVKNNYKNKKENDKHNIFSI